MSFRHHLCCYLFLWPFAISAARAAVPLDALGQYLVAHGYGGSQFVTYLNTYRLPINSNGKAGDLTIDTGAPGTVLFKASLSKLGLTQAATEMPVHGIFGKTREKLGLTTIHSLTMGNCTLMNVKAAVVSDPEGAHQYGSTDGIFGLNEMVRFGAVLDLRSHLLFVHPGGPMKNISGAIQSILTAQGYTPVDLRMVHGHLRARASVNGTACSLIVDTGAFLTTLDSGFARKSRIGGYRSEAYARGFGGSTRPISTARFSVLQVGGFTIKNASVSITDMDSEMLGLGSADEAAGVLGAEYLGIHGGIFDFNSGTLYLRPKSKQ